MRYFLAILYSAVILALVALLVYFAFRHHAPVSKQAKADERPAVVSLDTAIVSGGGFTKVGDRFRHGEMATYVMPVKEDGYPDGNAAVKKIISENDLRRYWYVNSGLISYISEVQTDKYGQKYVIYTYWRVSYP